MNLDISFGQYCEGNSPIHRLDPRAKILAAILYIVTVFLAKNLFAFCLLLLSAVALILVSRIPLRIVMKSMKPLAIILLLAAFSPVVPQPKREIAINNKNGILVRIFFIIL